MNIRNWILDIAAAFNYKLSEKQLDIYESDLTSLNLTDGERESLGRQVRQELDRFPALAQLCTMGRSAARTKGSTREDIKRWKREASSKEEGIRIFRQAFIEAGGDISKLPLSKSMAMEREPGEQG